MKGLTKKQREVLQVVIDRLEVGCCPSISEIAAATGATKNHTHRRLNALETKRYIVREYGKHQAIRVIRNP